MHREGHTKFDATQFLFVAASNFDEFAAEYYLRHASSQRASTTLADFEARGIPKSVFL
jgi:hypothetical protein